MIEMLLLLLAAHWVADYPLQGDFLANAKANGPLRVYHLVAHAGIHAAAVYLITGSLWIGMAEWALHAIADEAKVRGRTSFAADQAFHVTCKITWAIVATNIGTTA